MPNNFLDTILNTPKKDHGLKWLVREIKKLEPEQAIDFLRKLDSYVYGYPGNSIDSNSEKKLDKLLIKIIITFLIEKVIVYSKGSHVLHYSKFQTFNNNEVFKKHKHVSFTSIYNSAINLTRTSESNELSTLIKIIMPLFKEQMIIQQYNSNAFNRFYHLFAKDLDVSNKFEEHFGLNLKKVSILSWALLGFVSIELYKNEKYKFTSSAFLNFTRTLSFISDEEKLYFLNFVSLPKNEIKQKYNDMRSTDNGKLYDFEQQETFDRAIPRIAYQFPLLRNGDIYESLSMTSITQFMQMESFYRMMTFDIKDYKGKVIGPKIEDHIRTLMQDYINNHTSVNGIVGGDLQYTPDAKGKPKHEPDAILETDDYILFVESKSSAFSLKLYYEMKEVHIERFIESVKKSLDNIQTYVKYHQKRLKEKKVLKIISFYEENTMIMEQLTSVLSEHINTDEYLILGIDDVHKLLIPCNTSIDDIYFNYLEERPKHNTNFEKFMSDKGVTNKKLFKKDKLLKELVKEFGLI